ncbi:MAG TPA: DUF350 domain-containing protein [Cyanobacteria bacterium UBA8530]|nr:DUF350 domain-containing protein [Cyanobacteria bacterium UBA8530]
MNLNHLTTGALLSSVVYALLGMVLLMIGYKFFDLVNRLDFTAEIGKNNVAVAITVAGFFIGLAIVIAAAIA